MTDSTTDPTIDPFSGTRYKLDLVAESGNLKHYKLWVPGCGRLQSTEIIFTADHTTIFGDLCPGRNGVSSSIGIGLGFFSSVRGAHYLGEKFLSADWHQVLARTELDEMVEELAEHLEDRHTIRDLHGLIDDGDVRGFHDWFTDRGYEAEDVPGYGYKPSDISLLSTINRRFAVLYKRMQA